MKSKYKTLFSTDFRYSFGDSNNKNALVYLQLEKVIEFLKSFIRFFSKLPIEVEIGEIILITSYYCL